MLATFHNNKDGKCYPSHPQVAEASATGERSAERAAAKLKALGYCSFDENKGGRNKRNDYDFSEALKGVANGPLIDENPVRVTTFKKGETSSTATRNLVNTDKKPRQGDDRSKPSNKPIYKPRGEGSPLPRDSAASPSPKKATGLHQEKVVQMREINPATLAKMTASPQVSPYRSASLEGRRSGSGMCARNAIRTVTSCRFTATRAVRCSAPSVLANGTANKQKREGSINAF